MLTKRRGKQQDDKEFYYILANFIGHQYAGKVREMKGDNQKASDKEEQPDKKIGAVSQIKKKYGFSSSSNVSIYLSYPPFIIRLVLHSVM